MITFYFNNEFVSVFSFKGTDLSLRPPPPHTFRYSTSQPNQPQTQQQSQQQPVPAPPIQLPPAPPVPGPYTRPMHQMHCPPYPPYGYAYGQDMCYSPPYQPPYYTPKVYPSPYRRYMPAATAYYSPQPSDMYDTSGPQGPPAQPPTSSGPMQSSAQLPPPSGQLVPTAPPQHLEHYAPYYSGYSPSGGQCYTRSIQPPYMGKQMYELSIHSLIHSSDFSVVCVHLDLLIYLNYIYILLLRSFHVISYHLL